MVYVLTGMSLLFIAIGFIVTVDNAKYLLAGYNTMSEEERSKVDIHSYIPYFKKFHIFLGLSFLIGGLILEYFFRGSAAGIFLGVYPILAYMFFIWQTRKFSQATFPKWHGVGIIVLAGTLLFVIILFFTGLKEDKLLVKTNLIELQGSYGETLPATAIKNIELTHNLPQIVLKTNGFALGETRKGYFRTKDGETVKLILNSADKPYIAITKQSGEKIYFSSKHESNAEIYRQIKQALPGIAANQTNE